MSLTRGEGDRTTGSNLLRVLVCCGLGAVSVNRYYEWSGLAVADFGYSKLLKKHSGNGRG